MNDMVKNIIVFVVVGFLMMTVVQTFSPELGKTQQEVAYSKFLDDIEKNNKAKEDNLESYFAMLQNKKYGAMYNKYNTLIYADDQNTAAKALEIAKIEVEHRPTPDSYDLLAWSYYNLGDSKKALEIAEKFVAGKSFEPKLNFHLATIYKANNMIDKVAPLKEELLNSSYELGPILEKKIIAL